MAPFLRALISGKKMMKHWYSITFQLAFPGGLKYSNTYVGYDDAQLSLPRIQQAKKGQGLSDGAVMLSASYLGLMTEAEFKSKL